MFSVLRRWVLISFVAAQVVGLGGACSRRHSAPEQTAGHPLGDHPLFCFWCTQRAYGWIEDNGVCDDAGSYLFRDPYANVAALALLRAPGVLRLSPGITNAGPGHATLLTATRFELEVRAEQDVLIVILPDRSQVHLQLKEGDVGSIMMVVQEAMRSPCTEPFSLVRVVYEWARAHSRTNVADFLGQHLEPSERHP